MTVPRGPSVAADADEMLARSGFSFWTSKGICAFPVTASAFDIYLDDISVTGGLMEEGGGEYALLEGGVCDGGGG